MFAAPERSMFGNKISYLIKLFLNKYVKEYRQNQKWSV